ncbi:MAG: serine hydrolase domain-containing protein [Pseudomonadota bacterium]
MKNLQIEGFCPDKFSAVKDAFHENFISRGEIGASVSVTLDGETVVDLWGGWTDAACQKPWRKDTLTCVQSVSKEIMALALHMAVDRGLIEIDAPVAKYWPEFAQKGKQDAPVRWLLDHRIGLPVVEGATPGMAYDWQAMTEGLARTAPMWEPGTTPCYHSATYGYLIGEVLRRTTGKLPGEFVRDEIATPLGIDCVIGLRPDEEQRVATFLNKENHPAQQWINEKDNIFARSWKIFWDDEDFNSSEWRRAQVPSVNAHTNARALARLCGLMARGGELDGVRLLGEDALNRAAEVQWVGEEIQKRYMSMSLGFLMPSKSQPSTGPRCLGFSGAGGATAFADMDRRLGFAYAMNSMDPDATNRPRPAALVNALNACLRQAGS